MQFQYAFDWVDVIDWLSTGLGLGVSLWWNYISLKEKNFWGEMEAWSDIAYDLPINKEQIVADDTYNCNYQEKVKL